MISAFAQLLPDSGYRSSMRHFVGFNGPQLFAFYSQHGNSFAGQREKLDFEAFSATIDMHNGANVPSHKPVLREIGGQYDLIKFRDHACFRG
jgi:hypothetical protein